MWHIIKYFKKQPKPAFFLYRFAIISLIYSIANGMVGFILPILLEEEIKSLTIVGFILASSSIWNIITDILMGFMKKPPGYRLLLQIVGAILTLLFLSIWLWEHPWLLVLSTVIWGIYTELFSFITYDFVIKTSEEEDRAASFGLLSNFRSLGYALAPIIIGQALIISRQLTMFTGLFFALSLWLYINIQYGLKKLPQNNEITKRKLHFFNELRLWLKIGKKIYSLFFVFLVRGIADGVLTSFVPIFVAFNENLKFYAGFILSALSLPTALLSGWFGHLADIYGRKKFILLGLIISTLALFPFGYSQNGYVAIFLALMIGVGYSLYSPALEALLSSYIEEHDNQEAETISESGIVYNLGFVLGAALTGILTTILGGFGQSFAVLAGVYVICLVGFWLFAPQKMKFLDGKIN